MSFVCLNTRWCTYTADRCRYFRHIFCMLKYACMCMLVSTSKKCTCVHAYRIRTKRLSSSLMPGLARKQLQRKPATTSTVAPSPGQKRARPDEPPTPTSRINPRPPVYIKSRDVPLDFPLAALPDLVMCQALVHHNIAFSGPCAWFPGVPATLDGGVRLHPVSCHKISQSRAMICCNLDDGVYMQSSIIPSKASTLYCFQLEARGALRTGEKRSVKMYLYSGKPGQPNLCQLEDKDGSAPLHSKPNGTRASMLKWTDFSNSDKL